jgi:hypothetical protein
MDDYFGPVPFEVQVKQWEEGAERAARMRRSEPVEENCTGPFARWWHEQERGERVA